MSNSIHGHELFTCEYGTIVGNDFPRESMCRKNNSQLFDCLSGCNCTHDAHFQPLRVGIDNNHEHVVEKWPSKINVKAAPWL